MSVLKKLAGDTALYGVSSILGRLLNYALVILHTQIFMPRELASNSQLYSLAGILIIVYTYGMETAFFRFSTQNKAEADYYNLALSALVVSSLVLSGLLVGFSGSVAAAMGFPDEGMFVGWIAVTLAIDAIVAIPFARLRLEKRARAFATYRVINIVLNVGLNVFFLYFCRDVHAGKYLSGLRPAVALIYFPAIGAGYIILANLLANLAYFPMLWRLFSDFRFRLDWPQLRPMLAYGYPLLVMGLAGAVNAFTDRLMLQHWLPEGFYPNRTAADALGIYANCYKLSVFMALATQAFRYAAEPFFFSKAEDKNAPETFALVMQWFIIVCAALWVGVSLNLDLLKHVFLRRPIYWEGLTVVPLLLLGNLFLGVYNNLSIWFKLSGKTGYGVLITGVGAVIAVVGNLVAIPLFGYLGCAAVFAFSCGAMLGLCYWLGQRHYPIPYNLPSAVDYVVGAGVFIALGTWLPLSNAYAQTAFRWALCAIFLAAIYWLDVRKRGKIAPPMAAIRPPADALDLDRFEP